MSSQSPKKNSPVVSESDRGLKANAPVSTLGITVKKSENFSEWYYQIISRAELVEYYDISGCYILRPWAYFIWSCVQRFMGEIIQNLGVEDCYFPIFVTKKRLEAEKEHISGFSPEVAWVTRAGDSELAEPIAIRPSSETVMYPYYATWIRSYRDLPVKLNMWNNVIRWEFKHPQPFIRTREFLWQEGHCAYATKEEADKETNLMLDVYYKTFKDLMAIPSIPGIKSVNETFAGALYSYTLESFIKETGRGLQASTSHCLGQKFAKMFNIVYEDQKMERQHVWQISWGFSTRSIGLLVMMHSDDKGLVLPPRVARYQVVVIPVGLSSNDVDKEDIIKKADDVASRLNSVQIRTFSDTSLAMTPGWKFSKWELKGVPVRLEIGPKELKNNLTTAVLRYDASVRKINLNDLESSVKSLLDEIHDGMYQKAKEKMESCVKTEHSWDGFIKQLNSGNMILAPWCENPPCEDEVRINSAKSSGEQSDPNSPSMGAKTLCIPFHLQPKDSEIQNAKCFACNNTAKRFALWGRSY